MKALMNAWIEEMRETCDLSVLGGQRQRYEYFGYTHGGQQMVYTVNSLTSATLCAAWTRPPSRSARWRKHRKRWS